MKRLVLFSIVSIVAVTCSFAQVSKVGTAGSQFLKIWVEPRGAAMGGAYSAVTNDVTALYWNPAGIASVESPSLIFSDVEWFADIRNNFLGYVHPTNAGDFGVSVTVLSMGKEEITTVDEPNGTGEQWGASSMAFGLSYGRWFTKEFAFGVTAKYVYETILDANSSGALFDLGAVLHPEAWGSLRGSFVISNFGPDLQYRGGPMIERLFREGWPSGIAPVDVELLAAEAPPPLLLKFGLAYDPVSTPEHRVTLALDLWHPNDGREKVHVGGEYSWSELISLRGGFRYDPDLWDDRSTSTEGFTFGLGMKYPMGGQFYGFGYAGEDRGYLGLKHRFSLAMEF